MHLAKIRALYKELDQISGLNSSFVPIDFGFEEDLLGSYTRESAEEEEHFHFSLLFIGYGVKKPLSKEDREDLYRHEYAHYMQYNMPIPEEHLWKQGTHGSSWKYCCSLVNAVPTPYYRAGESLMKTDYKKVLENPWKVSSFEERDRYRREQEYRKNKNSEIRVSLHEEVEHPSFGKGIIEEIIPGNAGVHLKIRFASGVKKIDQKWLLRSRCR